MSKDVAHAVYNMYYVSTVRLKPDELWEILVWAGLIHG